jgi:hypothetical protein
MPKVIPDVPFFGNADDNNNCFQAVLKMILKYFEPAAEYSWQQLEAITAYQKDKYTWDTAACLWLAEHGYELKSITVFDRQRFVDVGEEYLVEFMGEATAKDQIAQGDIRQERRLMWEAINTVGLSEKREPKIGDLRQYLREGYLPFVNVNSHALSGVEGYTGHFVLDAGDTRVKFHDPGLPAHAGRTERRDRFEAAWAFPHRRMKGVTAVRLARSS